MEQFLARYYPAETLAKLERLASFSTYQQHHAFHFRLTLLQMCAFVLAAVEQVASTAPEENSAAFALELDQAGSQIAQMLSDQLPLSIGASEGIDALVLFLDRQKYVFTREYHMHRQKIIQAGKAGLLVRIATRLASK